MSLAVHSVIETPFGTLRYIWKSNPFLLIPTLIASNNTAGNDYTKEEFQHAMDCQTPKCLLRRPLQAPDAIARLANC